ncbi:variable charge X-linked protein 3B [Sylvia borin]
MEPSRVDEAIELSPGDSNTKPGMSPVEEAIAVTSGASRSDQELSPMPEAIEVVARDSTSDLELSSVEEDINVILRDSTSEEELSPVQEAILAISEDSPIDEELSKVEEAIEVVPEGSTSDSELSELGEAIKLFPDEKSSDKELSQGDTNEDEKLSPEDRKRDTQLIFGEDCNVEDMSQWEQDDIKPLSLWEEDADKELSQGEEHEDEELSQCEEHEDEELSRWDYGIQLTRMALLGGMDSDSSSPLEFPDLPLLSRHQKVLDWLEAHFPNVYGAEEEEKAAARHPPRVQRKRRQHNVEAQWQKLVKVMSHRVSHDKMLSKGKHRGAQEVSQGEAAIRDNTWQRPSGLVGDEEPLEGPSTSRAAEEEEPPEPLALRGKKAAAPSVLSGERTSPGTPSSLRALFNTPASSQAQVYVNPSVTSGTLSKAVLQLQALRQHQEARGAREHWIAAEREAAVGGQREGSPLPAPHSPPSPRPAQLGAQALRGQPAAPRKRPSRFRRALRALRGLFRCPCLRPRPEE